jgi:hypothetical protein
MFHVEPGQQGKGLIVGNAEPAEEILVKKSKAESKKRCWWAKTERLVRNIPNTQMCIKRVIPGDILNFGLKNNLLIVVFF